MATLTITKELLQSELELKKVFKLFQEDLSLEQWITPNPYTIENINLQGDSDRPVARVTYSFESSRDCLSTAHKLEAEQEDLKGLLLPNIRTERNLLIIQIINPFQYIKQ